MSRPDDSIASNLGASNPTAPQAGHPTGWPRPQGQLARDPVTGRPVAAAPTDQWQGYHFPGQAGQDQGQHYAPTPAPQYQPAPRTQPGGHAGAAAPGDYAPQFARYSGAEAAAGAPGSVADAYQPPRAPAAQGTPWPPLGGPQQPYASAGAPAGADPHWPGERLPYQNLTTGEPRSYDPNAYAPQGQDAGQTAQYGQYAPPAQGYADPQGGYQQQPYQGGYQEAGYQGQFAAPEQAYDPRTGQPYAQPGYGQADTYGQGYAPNAGGLDAGQPIAGHDADYEGDFAEAPPRKRRGLLVAGALVCAVAIGGGLAFVYKTFGQSGKRIGAPPIVAKSNTPSKAAPADPQGKQFENTNKKVLAKLDDAGGSASSAAGAGPAPAVPGMILSMPPGSGPASAQPVSNDTSAPSTRTVQTVPIGRDGNPVNGQQAVVTPRGLPGVQIDNSLNAPPAMRGAIPSADAPPPAAKPQPQRLAATPPASITPAGAERSDAPAPPPPAAPRKAPVPKVAKDPAAPAAAATATGSGYVAVLSSQKDRAAALRIYADLAQKYPDQLGSRQPEVQEATVADKGVFQRLVVGPPSSQQSAKELCTQLKAAGYASDCWVKQY